MVLYDKNKGDDSSSIPDLTVGKYKMVFWCPDIASDIVSYLTSSLIGHDLSPIGKKCIIKEINQDKDKNELIFVIELKENPVPVLVILGALGALTGIAYLVLIRIEKILAWDKSIPLIIILIILVFAMSMIFKKFKLGT